MTALPPFEDGWEQGTLPLQRTPDGWGGRLTLTRAAVYHVRNWRKDKETDLLLFEWQPVRDPEWEAWLDGAGKRLMGG